MVTDFLPVTEKNEEENLQGKEDDEVLGLFLELVEGYRAFRLIFNFLQRVQAKQRRKAQRTVATRIKMKHTVE